MSKLAGAGAFALLGGGVSAGGVVLSGIFSFDSTLPKELNEFKDSGHNEGCIKSLFPGLESADYSKVNDATSSSTITLDNSKKSDGCLVINWDKEEYKSGGSTKGSGNIRFLWAVQQEKTGFVVFTTAETISDSEKKLLGKGVAYSLKKEGEGNGKGALSAKKLVDSTEEGQKKKSDKDTTDSKFPKSNLLGNNQLPFWGFMNSKENMENMCKGDNCTGDKTTTFFEGYWEGKGPYSGTTGGGKKLGEGTSQLKDGGSELFGTAEGDMNNIVKDMSGQGEKKTWYGIGEPSSAS